MLKIFWSLIFSFAFVIAAQAQNTIEEPTMSDLCLEELILVEKKLEHSEEIIDEQRKALNEVKVEISNTRYENQNLKKQNEQLMEVAGQLLILGNQFVEQEDFESAISVFKMIMQNYPKSFEAATCAIWLQDYYKTLQTSKR